MTTITAPAPTPSTAIDLEQARFLMIEQQIRTWEVLDQSVLELLFDVKREDFVPQAYRALAFVDMEIPLGQNQVMMTPKMEARIIQEVRGLANNKTERALEIGTGSGYLTALLAKRFESVTSVEIIEAFTREAAAKLAAAKITNVQLKTGDAAESVAHIVGAHERFDVVVLTGSVPVMPQKFLECLQPNGRLFAVIGDAPVMKACLITKTGDASYTTTELFETVLAPLLNAKEPSRFSF